MVRANLVQIVLALPFAGARTAPDAIISAHHAFKIKTYTEDRDDCLLAIIFREWSVHARAGARHLRAGPKVVTCDSFNEKAQVLTAKSQRLTRPFQPLPLEVGQRLCIPVYCARPPRADSNSCTRTLCAVGAHTLRFTDWAARLKCAPRGPEYWNTASRACVSVCLSKRGCQDRGRFDNTSTQTYPCPGIVAMYINCG